MEGGGEGGRENVLGTGNCHLEDAEVKRIAHGEIELKF